MKGDPELRALLLGRLRAMKRDTGQVSNEHVRSAAHMLGLTPRQVRHLITKTEADRTTTDRWEPTEQHWQHFYAAKGNRSRFVRNCEKENIPVPGVRHVQRVFAEVNNQTLVHGAETGDDGLRKGRMALPRQITHRNNQWAMDGTPDPILVRPDDGDGEPFTPWKTTCMDEWSRLCLGVVISDQAPNSDTSMDLLADAMVGFTLRDGTVVEGMPDILLTDRGGDFLAKASNLGLIQEGIERRLTLPRNPTANGGVERLQGVFQQAWMEEWPGFLPGKRESYERQRAHAELLAHPESLMTFSAYCVAVQQMIEEYNEEHPHRGIGGLTPARRYADSSVPQRIADPAAIRQAILSRSDTRIVSADGIEFDTFMYQGPAIARRVGQRVTIRARREKGRPIEVYVRGVWKGQVPLSADQTLDQRGRIGAIRVEDAEKHLAYVQQGEEINTERMRKKLRAAGVPEADLPSVPLAKKQADKRDSGRTDDRNSAMEDLAAELDNRRTGTGG